MPSSFISPFIRQEPAARETATFYFEKPSGFRFTAGQFVETILPIADAKDDERIHCFSISSAPYENHLAFTTRMRDTAFKRTLRALTTGDAVEMEGPFGKFVVSPNTVRPIAFLIGGVGITPVFSIIKQAARDRTLTDVYLFYSNRSRAEAPFLTELTRLQEEHSGFHLVATMTDEPSWSGVKERISSEMICRYVNPSSTSFYTSGPPGMVKAMRDLLELSGAARNRVVFENFTGY